ncbi:hypothetical protein Tco_0523935 [Tanacetum coccineum]
MQGTKLQFKTIELLFRMFVVDTLRIIRDDHFRGTMQEEMQELGMQENVIGRRRPQNSKLLQDQDAANASPEKVGAVSGLKQQLLFLAGESGHQVDEDVISTRARFWHFIVDQCLCS